MNLFLTKNRVLQGKRKAIKRQKWITGAAQGCSRHVSKYFRLSLKLVIYNLRIIHHNNVLYTNCTGCYRNVCLHAYQLYHFNEIQNLKNASEETYKNCQISNTWDSLNKHVFQDVCYRFHSLLYPCQYSFCLTASIKIYECILQQFLGKIILEHFQ